MISYFGDFAEDATLYIPFNTFSSDDPSASVTITNLVDADIMVHKDGGTTQIATDGATVAIDYDTITGNHLITIDTSVDAAYSTGSDYMVRIEGTTVDGATINAWVGSFSIENRYVHPTLTDWVNAGRLDAILDAITAGGPTKAEMDTAHGLLATPTNITAGTITTVTTLTGHTPQTADHTAAIADIPTVAEFNARTRLDADYFSWTTDAVATVTTLTGHTPQTADHTAGIADIPTVAEFNARTQPTADYFDPAADTVVTMTNVTTTANVTNEVTADVTKVSGSATAADNLEAASLGIVTGTAVTGTLAVGSCTTSLTETDNDRYIGRTLVFTSSPLFGEATDITDYDGSTKILSYSNLTEAPVNGTTFVIL